MSILEQIQSFLCPELLCLIPVLYLIGAGMKKSSRITDSKIPAYLGAISMVLSALWVFSVTTLETYHDVLTALFTAVTQGVLCAGASVYANQLVKQAKKSD